MLGVVVPAHNEQALLGACLDSLHEAARTVAERADVRILVVLDACTDHSDLVARHRRVDTLPVLAHNVGVARWAGCAAHLIRARSRLDWLATTDADSTVDPAWLADHLDACDEGWDVRVGTVHVAAWEEHPDPTRARFRDEYHRGDGTGQPHVHGANLGVRARSYLAVGGFEPRATGEDVDLVARLDDAGHPALRTWDRPVVTSARTAARAPDGFAAHLVGLAPSVPASVCAVRI